MVTHHNMDDERIVSTDVSTGVKGFPHKKLLLAGVALIGLVLVFVLVVLVGLLAVLGNPSDKWEQPNDMGEYLSEKTGLQCHLEDEDWGGCGDEENELGVAYVYGAEAVNMWIADLALNRWVDQTPTRVVIPGGNNVPEWGIICSASTDGNIELAQDHCESIAASTKGRIIEGSAAGYDLSEFLESRKVMYDVPQTSFGDGVYKVGRDIVPGTYVSSSTGLTMCKWERWDSPLGDPSSVIEDSSSTKESLYSTESVRVDPEDDVFASRSCGSWKKKH